MTEDLLARLRASLQPVPEPEPDLARDWDGTVGPDASVEVTVGSLSAKDPMAEFLRLIESVPPEPTFAIVRTDYVPAGKAYVARATGGPFSSYLLINPADLDRLAASAGDPVVSVFGIPVLDRLPDDAALGVVVSGLGGYSTY
jgi:hypothetical protein